MADIRRHSHLDRVLLSILIFVFANAIIACTRDVAAPPVQPPFVGKIWLSRDPSAPLGTIRIFLQDGTLVMDSCVETYRLARWTSIGDNRISWQEDSARIDAETTITADELFLRLALVDGFKEEHYQLAQVPYVCPDARPAP